MTVPGSMADLAARGDLVARGNALEKALEYRGKVKGGTTKDEKAKPESKERPATTGKAAPV